MSNFSEEDKTHILEEMEQEEINELLDELKRCPVSGEPCEEYDNCERKNYCHLK